MKIEDLAIWLIRRLSPEGRKILPNLCQRFAYSKGICTPATPFTSIRSLLPPTAGYRPIYQYPYKSLYLRCDIRDRLQSTSIRLFEISLLWHFLLWLSGPSTNGNSVLIFFLMIRYRVVNDSVVSYCCFYISNFFLNICITTKAIIHYRMLYMF